MALGPCGPDGPRRGSKRRRCAVVAEHPPPEVFDAVDNDAIVTLPTGIDLCGGFDCGRQWALLRRRVPREHPGGD